MSDSPATPAVPSGSVFTAPAANPVPATGSGPGRTPVRWTPGRLVSLLSGVAIGALAAVLLLAGVFGVIADRAWRDGAGFFSSATSTMRADGYALTSETMDVDLGPGVGYPREVLGDLRFRVTGLDPSVSVFIGMAPTTDVDRYLGQVQHSQVTEVDDLGPRYRNLPGSAVPADPATQSFWSAKAVGAGTQTLTWTPENGSWTLVVMRADAAPGIAVRADAGADAPVLTGIAIAVLVAGAGLGLLAALLVIIPVTRALRTPRP